MRGREALALCAVALLVRLAFALVLDTPAQTASGMWEWGYEAGCIATSLREGQGFANAWTRDVAPWDLGSGATGWLMPAYPAFLALLLECTGGLARSTAWWLFAAQAVASAITCLLVARVGTLLGAPRAGRLAAWVLVLHPFAVWHAAQTVWDTTFAALGFTLVLERLASAERGSRPHAWTLAGVALGAALLINAAPLAVAPVVAWVAWRARPGFGAWIGAVAPCALGAFALALPWMLRNLGEVGTFSLRTNLGVELRVGNHEGADGRYRRDLHPSHSPEQFLRYREMGEAAYADWALDEALDWIRANPGQFVVLSLRRAQTWWIGEAPWTDPRTKGGKSAREDPLSWIKWIVHGAGGVLGLLGAVAWARARREPRPYLLLLFLVPPVYCVTHVMERYRWPIEPLLVLAAAWLVEHLWSRRRGNPEAAPDRPLR